MKKIKYNTKPTIIILLALILLTLSGCGPSKPKIFNPNIGTQGINIDFSEYNNFLKAKEHENIPIELKISNKGAYNLNETNMYGIISVVERDPYLKSDTQYTNEDFVRKFYIHGKTLDYPEGETIYVQGPTYEVGEIQGEKQTHNANIHLSICYPYKTTLTQVVCVDSDPGKQVNNPICRNQKKYTYSKGQGAPISISKIDSEMSLIHIKEQDKGKFNVINDILNGGKTGVETIKTGTQGVKPTYKITIKNEQKGFPFIVPSNSKDVSTAFGGSLCEKDTTKTKQGVAIQAKIGKYELVCNPKYITLKEQDHSICTLKDKDVSFINSNYYIPLTVNLYYNYHQTEIKKIDITKILT